MADYNGIIIRLRKRAEIRRQIPSRKSVQNGEPDRIAALLDDAADAIDSLLDALELTASRYEEAVILSGGEPNTHPVCLQARSAIAKVKV